MNDEIKEILEFKENADYKRLSCDEIAILRDYITNLQQENKELNDSNQWWNNRFNAVQRDYEDYKSRIEKAVEYMNNTFNIRDVKDMFEIINKLEDILNGRSDE